SYRFFDTETGKFLARIVRPEFQATAGTEFSPHGNYFAVNDNYDHIDIFKVSSGKLLRRLLPESKERTFKPGNLVRFRFSADEQILLGEVQLIFESADGESHRVSARLWDLSTGKILKDIVITPALEERLYFSRYVKWRFDALALSS